MNKLVLMGTVVLVASSLSACGRMADLEAPPAKKTERSVRSSSAGSLPEPATIYRPPSAQPIDGGPNTSPYSGSGANPDPR